MAVRNGKVTLGQMETTFSYSNPLDPLSASRGPQKPSTVGLCVEGTVEKGTQVDLEASEGLGGQKMASLLPGAGLGLAHSPLPGSPPCPVLSLSLPRVNASPQVACCGGVPSPAC